MKTLALLLCIPFLLSSTPLPIARLTTLYNSLDPQSISELLAFYHLYPETSEGKSALSDAWKLIHLHRNDAKKPQQPFILPSVEIEALISVVNQQPLENAPCLDNAQLSLIESISDHLSNRKLQGYHIGDPNSLIDLPNEEIDLSHALLLYQFKDTPLKVRQYEATLDLMALQILARLPVEASHLEKIQAINHFIFHEKRFRFPPHSLWAKDIDLYTFLPSVLDSRLGVCLGVSILYLSLAQRLDLPLEVITPPGHIFISYNLGDTPLNIETTAHGVHLPHRTYLGINTRHLQKRTLKEVIGLAFINQASVAWHKGEHSIAVDLYKKATPYMPHDPLLKMLLGYNYLFVGRLKEGKKLLEEIRNVTFDHAVAKETTPEDFLLGKVDAKGIQAIFSQVDETHQSILEKQTKLQKILLRHPHFREGILQLAITYLQLGRGQEACTTLEKYHTIDAHNPVVEYYLTTLYLNRFQYQKAWKHLRNVQSLTAQRQHSPRCLKELRHMLRALYPDPDAHSILNHSKAFKTSL